MRLLMKMVPIKIGKYFEQVAIHTKIPKDTKYYPLTYAHIDTFHDSGDKFLYDKLIQGETVFVDAHLAILNGE